MYYWEFCVWFLVFMIKKIYYGYIRELERISSIERKGMERSNRIKVLLMWLFCKYF